MALCPITATYDVTGCSKVLFTTLQTISDLKAVRPRIVRTGVAVKNYDSVVHEG